MPKPAPLYNRPSYVPKNFKFVGQGKHFKPKLGDKYYTVLHSNCPNQAPYSSQREVDNWLFNHNKWSDTVDFYIESKAELNTHNKYIVGGTRTNLGTRKWYVWVINDKSRNVIASCDTRENARKIARALNNS